MGAVQEQWVPPVGTLRRMQAEGKLTEADVYEVDELIDLLVRRYGRGEITAHFVAVVLQKVADSKCRDWLARTGRTGVWGK